MVKKGLQRLHFLRLLKKARLPQQLLVNFYRSVIESVITYCIVVWYSGCTSEIRSLSSRSLKQQRGLPAPNSLVWRTFRGHVAFGRPKPSSETLLTQVTTFSLFCHLENVTEHCMPTQQDLKIAFTTEQLLYWIYWRLFTKCKPLLIPKYMTKMIVSNVIHYITRFR